MNYLIKHIGIDPHTRTGKKLTAVKKLVVHYTANPGATAMNHYNYFENLTDRYASAHIFVDSTQVIEIIPLNEVAFHANDGSYRGVSELKPNANYLSIGIELCLEKDGTFHPNTLKQAAEVFAKLCKQFGLDEQDIVRHYDITHKNCPAPFVSNPSAFEAFKKSVGALLRPVKAPAPVFSPFVVVVDVSNLNVHKTPDVAAASVVDVVHEGEAFTVVGIVNNMYKLKSGLYISSNSAYTHKK